MLSFVVLCDFNVVVSVHFDLLSVFILILILICCRFCLMLLFLLLPAT
jgi:hypothetical protein